MTFTTAESAILTRLVLPESANMPSRFAEGVLSLQFNDDEVRRINELSERAQSGSLTSAEQDELDSYERVGHFLSSLKSKARKSLQASGGA